jgi:erythromycin esterase-like protein
MRVEERVEFYSHRAEITKRLIVEKGFTAVAVEGDLARRLSRESFHAW